MLGLEGHAAGPGGEALAVYESNAGVDRLTIEGRVLRAGDHEGPVSSSRIAR